MKPLAAFKPPPMTEETERVFRAVNGALNDVDRALFPPVETLSERRREVIAAYETVAGRFAAEAKRYGLEDWLRCSVLKRTFMLIDDQDELDEARRTFDEIERLGYSGIDPLISLRMNWAYRLAEAGETDEAQSIARRLLADIESFRGQHPQTLSSDLDDEMAEFCRRLGM